MGIPLRVLIIEDSDADTVLIVRHLKKGGYDPDYLQVQSAAEMTDALEREQWDVIISDYVMPEFSAPTALNMVKEYGRDIPFIVISGSIGEDTAVTIMKAGAHDYVSKENMARLAPAVQRELREALVRMERRMGEEALRRNEERLDSLYRVSQMIAASERDILNYALEEGVRLTGSKAGFIHLINKTLYTTQSFIFFREIQRLQNGKDEEVYFPQVAGTIAECCTKKKPLIVNKYEIGELKAEGSPPGLPLLNFIGVPVFDGDETVAVAGVGNSDREYDDTDARQLSLFMSEVWKTVRRKQAEEERHRLEQQLVQMQKMESVGQLAGGVAHDFNNLLTVILGNVEYLLGGLPSDVEKTLEILQEVKSAGENARALTRQLLAFGRKQVLEIRTIDLNTVIKGFEKMITRITGADINVRVVLEPQLARVNADTVQMEQILMNLVINARDAMPSGGVLTIETMNLFLDDTSAWSHLDLVAGSYVALCVSDTGFGMDSETKRRIFEPFFTTKGRDRGTGLGLSTVYGITKQHEGHIWVYSEPGKGSTFKIFLPAATSSIEKRAVSAPRPAGKGRGETVLVVEDEDPVRSIICRLLDRNGYHVIQASHGHEALQYAEKAGAIDLLLADVMMPDMNGVELADRLRALQPALRVLFMSGYMNRTLAEQGILKDDSPFLPKPFTAQKLLHMVSTVLGSADSADHIPS